MDREKLLEEFHTITDQIASQRVVFVQDPRANDLVYDDPFAFALAACLDRRAKSARVCRVPYFLKQRWGHLAPRIIKALPEDELVAALRESKGGWPLRMTDVARTVSSLSRLVDEQCDGDAQQLFEGDARTILQRLRSIPGVGPGISNMLLMQRIKFFGLQPDGLEVVNVKADVHIIRVFYRMGLAEAQTEVAALQASAMLRPLDRIAADQACWHIGRDYCHTRDPKCSKCPARAYCDQVGAR